MNKGESGDVEPPTALRPTLFLLRFPDPAIEREYLQSEYSRDRRWVAASLVLALAITISFFPLDAMFIPAAAVPDVQSLRLLVLCTMPAAGIATVLLVRRASLATPILGIIVLLFGITWAAIRWHAGPAAEPYVAFGVAETILFTYGCMGLPFRQSAGVVALMVVPILVLAGGQGLHSDDFWYTTASLVTVTLIASYAAYRHEWSSRERFETQRRFEQEYARRLGVEQSRSEWLSLIAGFTRHELKNAIAGIGSSLELIERSRTSDPDMEYVARARHSLHFMRTILQQVANATSLETALEYQEVEELNLSRLLSERLREFGDEAGPDRFQFLVREDVRVRGNADSLVQMLDKLLSNALEHAGPTDLIRVTLTATGCQARLEVMNHGVPLPPDPARLFEPFVSLRGSNREGNLGLGLYVAQMIARRHGGAISVSPSEERPGATFTVELPLLGP